MTATEGEQLKIDGMAANAAAATAPHRGDYRQQAEKVLARFVAERREFTADDVHRAIPAGTEPPHSRNVLPSLMGIYSAQKVMVPVGWANSARASRHASRNRVWKGNAACDAD